MIEIVVPTINTNDTDAILRQWLKADGESVRAGELIAVLETTKASFDLESPGDGLLATSARVGDRCDFGRSIGRIYADEAERERARAAEPAAAEASETPGLVITAAAQRLIESLDITPAQVRGLGKRVIKEADIQALAGGQARAVDLSPQQQTIARTVSLSRRSIPDAFLLQRIDVTAALAAAATYREQRGVIVGLPELLIWTVARLQPAFPLFFGALDDNLVFEGAEAAHVGVTMDVGKGLFVPVVRDAGGLSLDDTAARLAGFRMKALRNTFDAADLTGGTITVSLNTDEGTVFVQPIILPPQTCMLSLGATLRELALDGERVVERRVVNLGVAYDHRVVNGFQAGAFARAIKAGLEAPEMLRVAAGRGVSGDE